MCLCCVYAVECVSENLNIFEYSICGEGPLCGCTCVSFCLIIPKMGCCKLYIYCNMEWVRYDDNDLCVYFFLIIFFRLDF